MHRRDLLKLSPLALASTIGHVALAETPAPTPAETLFNVRTYGATGDGKTLDTPAINKAIAAVAAAGGGTLVFPAGTYLCFTIHLKSNVDLYLSRGCTILAAASPLPTETTGYNGGAYDPAGPKQPWEEFQDYGHNHWPNSLFYGEDLHDISILGPGLIHGKGLTHGGHKGETRGDYPYYDAEQSGVGNKAISLKNCRNVLLRDFSVLKGGHFALLATGVDNLTIDNLLIDTDRDGFDIDCCRNVRVSNCTVNSPWDDAIVPKSSYALGLVRPSDNITIANCYVTGTYELGTVIDGTWKKWSGDKPHLGVGRIKCGTESNGGFRNIAISNCIFEGCRGFCLETSDGAFLEDVAVTNLTMRDIVDAPIFIRLNSRNRGPKDTMRPGTLRRVVLSNIVSHNSASSTSSIISGVPGNLIEDLKFTNCYFGHQGIAPSGSQTRVVPEREDGYPELSSFGATPSNAFYIRHLKNLEMSHIEVAPAAADPRPAFYLEDVNRADFFAVTAPGSPNFSLHNVTDLRIHWSRAAKDTALAKADNQNL